MASKMHGFLDDPFKVIIKKPTKSGVGNEAATVGVHLVWAGH